MQLLYVLQIANLFSSHKFYHAYVT